MEINHDDQNYINFFPVSHVDVSRRKRNWPGGGGGGSRVLLARREFCSSGGDWAGLTFVSAGVRVGPWETAPAAVAPRISRPGRREGRQNYRTRKSVGASILGFHLSTQEQQKRLELPAGTAL
ncbi:hypothetical protein MTO96_001538 [Rhipicephalus appendiculatus]